MLTKFVGSGGLGDSVILSTKLLNIITSTKIKGSIHYQHLESDKRKSYEKPLNEYWTLVKQLLTLLYNYDFNFDIKCYPHGKFWDYVPHAVFNTATGLTTKVDDLCAAIPPSIIAGHYGYNNYMVVVADGGGGSRGISTKAINELYRLMGDKVSIVALGVQHCPHLDPGVINRTSTTTLAEALYIVNDAKTVVGPDGILTYHAAAYGIPTITFFHEARLIEQYSMYDLPLRHGKALVNGGFVDDGQLLVDAIEPYL